MWPSIDYYVNLHSRTTSTPLAKSHLLFYYEYTTIIAIVILQVWDISGKLLIDLQEEVSGGALSPDGSLAAIGFSDGSVKVKMGAWFPSNWNTYLCVLWKIYQVDKGQEIAYHQDKLRDVRHLQFSPDGTEIVYNIGECIQVKLNFNY